jgi:hypothetical protein
VGSGDDVGAGSTTGEATRKEVGIEKGE